MTGPTIKTGTAYKFGCTEVQLADFPHLSLFLHHQVRIITRMLLTIIIMIGALIKHDLFTILDHRSLSFHQLGF